MADDMRMTFSGEMCRVRFAVRQTNLARSLLCRADADDVNDSPKTELEEGRSTLSSGRRSGMQKSVDTMGRTSRRRRDPLVGGLAKAAVKAMTIALREEMSPMAGRDGE